MYITLPVDQILLGNCLTHLRTLPDASVDSIVTDPPYGLGPKEPTIEEIIAYLQGANLVVGGDFMNNDWEIPSVAVWKECFRILKPGGYVLCFAGTRTFDIMSMGIRAAGFENRDTIATEFGPPVLQWVHAQGFPKNHNISKAIDKSLGAERKVVGTKRGKGGENLNKISRPGGEDTTDAKGLGAYGVGAKQKDIDIPVTAPESEEAKTFDGFGTALKPSWEPILVFRKPIEERTVALQVMSTGTGAMNIDACRVGGGEILTGGGGKLWSHYRDDKLEKAAPKVNNGEGRWPANVLFVHSDACKKVGTKKVPAPVINRFDDGMKPFGEGAGHGYTTVKTGDADGNEEIAVYECTEGCPVKALDEQSGISTSTGGVKGGTLGKSGIYGHFEPKVRANAGGLGDKGGASRFYAQFEADAPEVYECAEGCPVKTLNEQSGDRKSTLTGRADPNEAHEHPATARPEAFFGVIKGGIGKVYADEGGAGRFYAQFEPDAPFHYTRKANKGEATVGGEIENTHPTKKPIALMKYLVRLVTPKGGVVLDPYCGSGTTCAAAIEEGMHFVGMERDPKHHKTSQERCNVIGANKNTYDAGRAAHDLAATLEED